MERHVKNYMDGMGFDKSSFIPCEVCGTSANDIHHIEPRSSFGSTKKEEQDNITNLIALCRWHHGVAHGPGSREWKIKLKEIVGNRLS